MSLQRSCCCSCPTQLHDCLNGDTIDTGCCHACDTLLLWCERPADAFRYHARDVSAVSGTCIKCIDRSWASLPPVQAIYHYYNTFYRVAINANAASINSLLPPYPRCPTPCVVDGYEDCTSCNPPLVVTSCACGSLWSQYQIDSWEADPGSRWGPEIICHKGGASISATHGRLESQLLGIVYFERWWKIAEGTLNCEQYRIYVPECTETESGWSCSGGLPVQGDNLVPKFWIYACSGCPLFDFDIDDAIAKNYITQSEADDMRAAFVAGNQPLQDTLAKMAQGGYFDSRDWRQVQVDEWADLNVRFPGAGYAACASTNVATMDELGPFRRRLTAPFALNEVQPYLRRGDVPTSAVGLQVDAGCFINYPGGFGAGDADDYEYWADRQWVYFRAVPGGWTYAAWDSAAQAGGGMSEDDAILNGFGRNDPDCVAALRGLPLGPETCSGCIDPCEEVLVQPVQYCNCDCEECEGEGWTGFLSTGCPEQIGGIPFPADPNGENTGLGGAFCDNLGVEPFCEGVRFVFTQYRYVPQFAVVDGACVDNGRYDCRRTVFSYLVEARRSVDSWLDSVPYTCRKETPPLPVFKNFPAAVETHQVISPICRNLVLGNPVDDPYTADDFCCGGFCANLPPATPIPDPYCGRPYVKDCDAVEECPPHALPQQIDCIGHAIDCEETPPP